MRSTIKIALVCCLVLASFGSVQAQDAQRISVPFSDPARPGQLRIELVNGCVEVESHDGAEVEFEVRAGRSDETDESEETDETERVGGGGDSGGMRRIPNNSFSFSVEEEDNVMWVETDSWAKAIDVVARVPRDTALKLECVNGGDMTVRGARGEHELSNVNGAITALDVSGSVVAETVNGGVKVAFAGITSGKSMAFATLNGDIDVTFPASLKAELRVDSGRGDIYTDFDVDLQSRAPEVRQDQSEGRYKVEVQREVRGLINGGGPEMRFSTFNGSIYLRKEG